MADRRRWKQRFARLVLALELAGASGCLSFLHPVAPPPTACLEAGAVVPMDCRDHVHVFLINGVDPCRLANLVGVRDYVKSLGYINTYYGELTDWWWFLREVRRVHQEDSDARIVVIGYSAGGSMAYHLAEVVHDEGIIINLLVTLDAKTVFLNFDHIPANVGRLLNVTSLSKFWNGKPIDGAENIFVNDVWHFGSPSHLRTLDAVTENLAAVATSGDTVPLLYSTTPSE